MNRTVLWNGNPIDDMPADVLREIIIELVTKAEEDRCREYKRQLHAFDHLLGERRFDQGTANK